MCGCVGSTCMYVCVYVCKSRCGCVCLRYFAWHMICVISVISALPQQEAHIVIEIKCVLMASKILASNLNLDINILSFLRIQARVKMYEQLTGYIGIMKREIQDGQVAAEIPQMFGGLITSLNKSFDLVLSKHEAEEKGMGEEKVTELSNPSSSAVDASLIKIEDTAKNVPAEPSVASSSSGEGEDESKDSAQQIVSSTLLSSTLAPDHSTGSATSADAVAVRAQTPTPTLALPASAPGPPNAFCTLRAGLETVRVIQC